VQRWLGLISALALGGLLVGATLRAGSPPVAYGAGSQGLIPAGDEIPLLGRLLFGDYLLAFEALSFLLLVAAVGALIMSKRRFD
jgi:NADH-quinone oxidoreductase subunit J